MSSSIALTNSETDSPTNSYVKDLFDAIGIKTVCWIDDKFFTNQDAHQEPECIDKILLLHRSGEHEKVNDLVLNVLGSENFVVSSGTPDAELRAFLKENIVDSNIKSVIEYLGTSPDLSPENFDLLERVLRATGAELKTLCWSDWLSQENHFNSLDNCMFIVDHDFSDEPKAYGKTGGIIIKKLTEGMPENSYCFLLTHAVEDHSSEETLRSQIAQSIEDKKFQSRFSVVSKKSTEAVDEILLRNKLGKVIKTVYLRKINVDLFDIVSTQVAKQLDSLRNDLCQSSSFEIERIIFNRTRSEGGSEIELLRRFINIKNDQALSESMADIATIQNIAKIRSIQSIQKSNLDTATLINYSDKFNQYRNVELFDDFINVIQSPLSVGDIFELTQEDVTTQFILVGQDCELAVRDDGTRNCSEVTLIPFEEETQDLPLSNSKRNKFNRNDKIFEGKHALLLPDSETQARKLKFDFTESISVSVDILDFSVFNKLGNLELDTVTPPEFFSHLPGWGERFQKLIQTIKNSFSNEKEKDNSSKDSHSVANFSLSSYQTESVNGSIIKLNGRRVKRLKQPFKNDLVHKYFIYKSRNAFEHDFTS